MGCRTGSALPKPTSPDPIWAEHEVHVTGVIRDDACTVLALHGRGDTPSNFRHIFADYPGNAQFLIPQAPIDPRHSRPSWFAGSREVDAAELGNQVGAMADALVAALPSAPLPHPVRGKPVVTGFSQGGMLSFAIATHHPDAVGAAFPMGGFLPEPLHPTTRSDTPITAFHGTADRVIPFEAAKHTQASLEALDWPATLVPFEGIQHRIPPEMKQQLFEGIAAACATQTTSR